VVSGCHPRCLVVDDETLICWSLVRFLEARGLEARSVATAELALALLREWPVDYLISDIRLPGMDGLELVNRCQTLRHRPGIILITGSGTPSFAANLPHLGVLGVIEKPFIFDSIARLLSGVLQQPGNAGA
jgi:DNA-binding NtrC family response regulator